MIALLRLSNVFSCISLLKCWKIKTNWLCGRGRKLDKNRKIVTEHKNMSFKIVPTIAWAEASLCMHNKHRYSIFSFWKGFFFVGFEFFFRFLFKCLVWASWTFRFFSTIFFTLSDWIHTFARKRKIIFENNLFKCVKLFFCCCVFSMLWAEVLKLLKIIYVP